MHVPVLTCFDHTQLVKDTMAINPDCHPPRGSLEHEGEGRRKCNIAAFKGPKKAAQTKIDRFTDESHQASMISCYIRWTTSFRPRDKWMQSTQNEAKIEPNLRAKPFFSGCKWVSPNSPPRMDLPSLKWIKFHRVTMSSSPNCLSEIRT